MSDRLIQIRRTLRELQDPLPPNRERRCEDKRIRILEATLELALTRGWSGLTVESVATRAKVSKQTIYRWWTSKGDLLFDAVASDGFRWPAFPDSGDFRADLTTGVRNIVTQFSERSFDALMRAMLTGASEDEDLAKRLDQYLSTVPLAFVMERIESAEQAGQIGQSTDPATLAEIVYGAAFRRWLFRSGSLDFEFAGAIVSVVLDAVESGGSAESDLPSRP